MYASVKKKKKQSTNPKMFNLINKEMQIKDITSHLSTQQKLVCLTASNVGEAIEKQIFTYTASKNVDLYSHSER